MGRPIARFCREHPDAPCPCLTSCPLLFVYPDTLRTTDTGALEVDGIELDPRAWTKPAPRDRLAASG